MYNIVYIGNNTCYMLCRVTRVSPPLICNDRNNKQNQKKKIKIQDSYIGLTYKKRGLNSCTLQTHVPRLYRIYNQYIISTWFQMVKGYLTGCSLHGQVLFLFFLIGQNPMDF